MPCGHAACIFASSLNKADCEPLCAICHIKHFDRGQNLDSDYWKNCVFLTLEGVLLDMRHIGASAPVTVGIHAPGSLGGLENLFSRDASSDNDVTTSYCLTNCSAAVFPAIEMRGLIRLHPDLSHPILKDSVLRQMKDKTDMLLYLGFGDANASVSYATNYLRSRGLECLTHEQIALICNRSRQTVTATLKALQKESPED